MNGGREGGSHKGANTAEEHLRYACRGPSPGRPLEHSNPILGQCLQEIIRNTEGKACRDARVPASPLIGLKVGQSSAPRRKGRTVR